MARVGARITVGREAVLGYRVRAQGLDRRPDGRHRVTGADVLDLGVQDTGTGGALWALANRGVPLAADACLARHARRQAERMAAAGRLSHTPDLGRVARACGLRAWGENVARTLSTDDGRGVVGLWMDSPGHRRNLLDGTYRRVGHAAVRKGGGWWVVQLLGRRR